MRMGEQKHELNIIFYLLIEELTLPAWSSWYSGGGGVGGEGGGGGRGGGCGCGCGGPRW